MNAAVVAFLKSIYANRKSHAHTSLFRVEIIEINYYLTTTAVSSCMYVKQSCWLISHDGEVKFTVYCVPCSSSCHAESEMNTNNTHLHSVCLLT